MTIVNFLLIAAIFIFLLVLNSFFRQYIRENKYEIKKLQKSLDDIKDALSNLGQKSSNIPKQKPEKEPSVSVPLKAKTEEKVSTENIPESAKTGQQEERISAEKSPVAPKKGTAKEVIAEHKALKKRRSFFEKHPDLERFIGENLVNKIGIVILVLGIAFFVKYAIDKNWINEIGRVVIGILSAGGLIALAHKLRKNYKSFSSVLIGGGLAVLYFTITLAFHTKGYPLYQQQTVSFIILIFITVFAVFLSLAYNRIEIAVLAILGGFASPFMVSDATDSYIVLFTYMMLLNVGMLVISYYKKWRLVIVVAFVSTVLLFASWLIPELFANRYSDFKGAIFFATGFYVVFFLMNIIYNLKHNLDFKAGDISLILSNTFLYFTYTMLMLSHINEGAYKGLFTILLAVFNFIFAYYIHQREKTDANLLYLLIGLVLTFVTLAIPLQLKGNYITLFWSVESVLLLWLGQKSGFKILKLGSAIVAFLMLISIVMDWNDNYGTISYLTSEVKHIRFLLNKMFITSLIAGGSLIVSLVLLRKEKENIGWIFPAKVYRSLVLCSTLLVFYIGGLLEVIYQSNYYFSEYSSRAVAVYAYNAFFILVLLAIAHKLKQRKFSIVIAAISTTFVLVFLIAISHIFSNNAFICINGGELLSTTLLIFRWLAIIAVYASGYLLFKLINELNLNQRGRLFNFNMALFIFTILYLLSADLDTIGVLITRSRDILVHTQKIGYAILWGVSSFLLMIIGMKRKEKIIRIFSLVLFAITIVKLFVYDISNITEGGKIIAFILLGVLLLIISFMYHKVKKLVIDDNYKKAHKEPESKTK